MDLRQKALSLPLKPGVYIMMDAQGAVIYVGKAKMLKNRVSQYFGHTGHNDKTMAMVSQVSDFDVIVVKSEFEALVLESSLIKRHQPKYNILLKDDKGYPFIRIDMEKPYPFFTLSNKGKKDNALYFGPYGGRQTTQKVIDALSEAFSLPTCGKRFPQDFGKSRPCLQHHMNRCPALCRGTMSEAEYKAVLQQAIGVLQGKTQDVEREIHREMEEAAENLAFEKAAQLRDRLRSVTRLGQRQNVVAMSFADTDVVGCFAGEAKTCVALLHYLDGNLIGCELNLLPHDWFGGLSGAISAFLQQYYLEKNLLARDILLPCALEDHEALSEWLTQKAGHKVTLSVPQRGTKKKLLELAEGNAREEVLRLTTKEDQAAFTLTELQKQLNLPAVPCRIEAYDMSHTAGDNMVGAMVVFEDAWPRKKAYRKFTIKTAAGGDDYAATREVLTRRLDRFEQGDEKFAPLPDLFLMDGGQAHAAAAQALLAERNLSIPVFGMVKDTRHRTRALVSPDGQEVSLTQVALFAFIGRIQEETHRFAITFHQERRAKSTVLSVLDGIPGLGPARRNALLSHFKTVKAIKNADMDALRVVLPPAVAGSVYAHLHKQEE